MSASSFVGRAAILIAWTLVTSSAAADLVLVSPTTPPCPIVVVASDDAVPSQLADKLDAKQMQVVTVVRVAASNISADKPTPYLQRVIEFTETK